VYVSEGVLQPLYFFHVMHSKMRRPNIKRNQSIREKQRLANTQRAGTQTYIRFFAFVSWLDESHTFRLANSLRPHPHSPPPSSSSPSLFLLPSLPHHHPPHFPLLSLVPATEPTAADTLPRASPNPDITLPEPLSNHYPPGETHARSDIFATHERNHRGDDDSWLALRAID